MAEIKLNDINSAMDSFLKKADEVKLRKKDLMDNMPQLLQAIKMFDRLQELYNSVSDKDSPRAKNYFNLAQQIASINEGWQNAHQQVSREAFLADREGAGYPDRLSKEESEQLRKLMQSSKLKDFVEFLDMESPQTYEKFKGVVLQEAESMVGTKVVQDALRDYYLATSHDISKSNLSLREWLSVKLAEFVESINKDSEEEDTDKPKGKATSDDTLVQDEEERQEKVKTDQAVAEIVKTSGKIDSALRKKEPEKSQTKVKVKSKPWKAPKGTWMGDLVQLLKWAGYLAGGIAAVAGIAKVAKDYIDGKKESKEKVDKAFEAYLKGKENVKEKELTKLDDPESAGRYIKETLAELRNRKDSKELGLNFSKSTIDGASALLANDSRDSSMIEDFIASIESSASPAEIAIIRALLYGLDTATWVDNGVKKSIPMSGRVFGSELSDEEAAARLPQIAAENRKGVVDTSIARPRWVQNRGTEYMKMMWNYATNPKTSGWDKFTTGFSLATTAAPAALVDVVSWGRNALVAGDDVKLPDEWYSWSQSEREKWVATNSAMLRKLARRYRNYGVSDAKFLDLEGNVDPGVSENLIGEIVSSGKLKKELPNVTRVQKSGNLSEMIAAMNSDSYRGRSDWKLGDPDSERSAFHLMSYKDMGSDVEYKRNLDFESKYKGTSSINNISNTVYYVQEITDRTQVGEN